MERGRERRREREKEEEVGVEGSERERERGDDAVEPIKPVQKNADSRFALFPFLCVSLSSYAHISSSSVATDAQRKTSHLDPARRGVEVLAKRHDVEPRLPQRRAHGRRGLGLACADQETDRRGDGLFGHWN